jgi:hypothetical protein
MSAEIPIDEVTPIFAMYSKWHLCGRRSVDMERFTAEGGRSSGLLEMRSDAAEEESYTTRTCSVLKSCRTCNRDAEHVTRQHTSAYVSMRHHSIQRARAPS